jgi:hypothetical protein
MPLVISILQAGVAHADTPATLKARTVQVWVATDSTVGDAVAVVVMTVPSRSTL